MRLLGDQKMKPDMLIRIMFLTLAIMMILRIFLVRFIRYEGVGVLAAPMDIFLISYGMLSIAFTVGTSKRILSYKRHRLFYNAVGDARRMIIYSIGISFGFGGFILLLSKFVSLYIFNSSAGFLTFCAVGIAIAFLSCQGAIRGLFEGFGMSVRAMISEPLFAILSFMFSGTLSIIGYQYGLKANALLKREDLSAAYGACGAALGVAIALLVSLIILFIQLHFSLKQITGILQTGAPRYLGKFDAMWNQVVTIALIVAFPFFINILDERVFMSLSGGHESGKNLIENWGVFYGGVIPVPIVIALIFVIFSLRSVYKICSAFSRKERKVVIEEYDEKSRFLMMFLFPMGMWTIVLSDTILRAVYVTPKDEATRLLQEYCVVMPLLSLQMLLVCFMLRLKKNAIVILNFIIGLIIHIITLAIIGGAMHKTLGAVIGAQAVTCLFLDMLTIWEIKKILRVQSNILRTTVFPMICALAASLIVYFLNIAFINLIGEVLTIAACVFVGSYLYIAGLLITGAVSENEATQFPGGGFLCILLSGFRFGD